MQRPGPLQELPLERFLPTYPNLPSKSDRSNKRPLSPGSPSLYSPTKRRILNSEGIFTPGKICKTPVLLARPSPARFSDILASPASPARILDFGLPKKDHGGEPTKRSLLHTPTQTQTPSLSSRKILAPSPELNERTFRRVSSAHQSSIGIPSDTEESSTSSTRPAVAPIDILRELPPLPDPQSIHYPGFVVFQDTHITIYPADFNPEGESNVETNMDCLKENLQPRRKTLRKATLETLKLEVMPIGKSKLGTPNRVIEDHGPTGHDLSSPGSPMKIDARKKLRRMMEEDVVEGQNDDDE